MEIISKLKKQVLEEIVNTIKLQNIKSNSLFRNIQYQHLRNSKGSIHHKIIFKSTSNTIPLHVSCMFVFFKNNEKINELY